MGAVESARRFAARYGCTREVEEAVPDRADDGTRTTRTRHLGCEGGAEVVLDAIEGGGHVWPGGWQYLPAMLVGRVTRDYHGSDMLFDFWGRHGLEPAEAGGDGGR